MLVETYRLPGELPSDVQQLFAGAEAIRIAFGLDWYRNLVDAVGPTFNGAWIYVLRQDGVPVAAIPLRADGAGWQRSLNSLGNFYTTIYEPVLRPGVEGTVLAPLIEAVCRDHAPVTRLQFGPMEPGSPGFAALRDSLRAAGLVTYEYFCHGNWFEPIDTDWASYLARRDGGLRSTIKRMDKKLGAAGARIEILTDAVDVARGCAAFEAVYGHSWKRPEPFPAFMPGLIDLCARRGWMRLGVIWLENTPIAAQFWIVANGRAEIYKLAYDESFKGFTPGTVLSARLMQHVIDVDRVTEVDYLIGDEKYKTNWMGRRRERHGLVAYNRRTVAGVLGWLRECAARWLKRRGWRRGEPVPSQASA